MAERGQIRLKIVKNRHVKAFSTTNMVGKMPCSCDCMTGESALPLQTSNRNSSTTKEKGNHYEHKNETSLRDFATARRPGTGRSGHRRPCRTHLPDRQLRVPRRATRGRPLRSARPRQKPCAPTRFPKLPFERVKAAFSAAESSPFSV